MRSKTTVVRKFYADGRVEDVNEQMTLSELQAFVGGYIEYVKCTLTHRALIVNEAGFLHRLSPNLAATKVCHPSVFRGGPLRGNALLVKA